MKLVRACENGKIEEVKALLESREKENDPNQLVSEKNIPLLSHICQSDLPEEKALPVIQLLLDHGANVEKIAGDEELMSLLSQRDDRQKILAILIKMKPTSETKAKAGVSVSTAIGEESTAPDVAEEGLGDPGSKLAEQVLWSPLEHISLGNQGFSAFVQKTCQEADRDGVAYKVLSRLKTKSGNLALRVGGKLLAAGEIVALAGDFYGPNPIDQPISFAQEEGEQNKRFRKAYVTLFDAERKEVKRILKRIMKGLPGLKQAIAAGESPSHALERQEMLDNIVFAFLAKHIPGSWFLYRFFNSRYVSIGLQNFDHFQEEAKKAYRAGHRVACANAIRAIEKGDLKLYRRALAQELFACHYLTDLFAAGHIRTPRKQLYDQIVGDRSLPGDSILAGLLAKEMHDEDGRLGLTVTCERIRESKDSEIKEWRAFGDDCYFDPQKNDTNKDFAVLAVQAGLKDVYEAYARHQRGEEIAYTALSYVPIPKENFTPLFEFKDGQIWVRGDVNDSKCTTQKPLETRMSLNPGRHNGTISWSPAAVFMKRKITLQKESGPPTELTEAEKTKVLAELEQIGSAPAAKLGCNIF